jgi:hypothetical protein
MTALLAWFSPTRWAILAGFLLALLAALAGLHRHGVNAGREEVRAEWAMAKANAQATQNAQAQAAEQVLSEETEVIRIVYRDRIREVIKYVPSPDTTCPADSEFVRLFNAPR